MKWDILSNSASINLFSVIIAAFAAIFSVIKINNQKSYELLTKERLRQLEFIRETVFGIRMLTMPENIYEIKQGGRSVNQYAVDLEEKTNQLFKVITITEKQERIIQKELEKLKDCAVKYFADGSEEFKTALLNQNEVFFTFLDIYDWSLWQYVQKLYHSDKFLTWRYDMVFAKTYLRAFKDAPDNLLFKGARDKEIIEELKKYSNLSDFRLQILYNSNK